MHSMTLHPTLANQIGVTWLFVKRLIALFRASLGQRFVRAWSDYEPPKEQTILGLRAELKKKEMRMREKEKEIL